MTLDKMMTMAKADRYTEDGKKEIQDAKRYKPGEISEATGLQKQNDGTWAPPKKGAPKGAKNTAKAAGSEKSAENKNMEQSHNEGWAIKAFTNSQQKQMEKMGFKAQGNNWVAEQNGHTVEIKVNQTSNPFMSSPYTDVELFIDGDKKPYKFGGAETIDPNSMVKLQKALKEQGYN